MATKRTAAEVFEEELLNEKKPKPEPVKKHTLDSDEEDSGDDETYNILNEDDIEGEEDGVAKMEGEVKLTPFNMKEEMEEGHFDAEGHFQWDKNNDIKDNWLDNLDWVKIKAKKDGEPEPKDESSDSEDDDDLDKAKKANQFNAIDAYRRILELMQPKETIKRALQRLGGKSARMSSAERWKQKKAGIVDPNAVLVIELTELTNTILTKMGNMDIYEETYEQIHAKYAVKTVAGDGQSGSSAPVAVEDSLDMYADDFDTKEKAKIIGPEAPSDSDLMKPPAPVGPKVKFDEVVSYNNEVLWEFKWKQEDEEVHSGFSSGQMLHWVKEGYFKTGVFVRKCGQDASASFNSSNRIDFELYL